MPNSADRPRCSREMTPGTADAVPRPGTPAAACSVVGTRASTESGAGPGPGRGTAPVSEAERFLRELFECVPIVAVMLDTSGGVIFCNEQLAEVTGHPRDATIGQNWFDLFVPAEQRQAARRVFTDAVSGESLAARYENDILTRDGQRRTIAWVNTVLHDDDGRPAGTASLGEDVTERRNAEEQRRRLEAHVSQVRKLESLRAMAGGIAHDFNNALQAILGNVELLLSDVPQGSLPAPEILEIETAARRAAELTGKMLDYTGMGRTRAEAVDLTQLVRESAAVTIAAVPQAIRFVEDLQDPLPMVSGDPSQFGHVLLGLVFNAVEAIGDAAGVITVRTGAEDVEREDLDACTFGTERGEGRYVFLEVKDTGCGMDEQAKSRVFDPFFTTKFTGRGLGLSSVLGIVASHEGAIRVRTKLDEGAEFRILLPATPDVPAEGESAGPGPSAGALWRGKGTVLLVDDEEAVRRVNGLMLQILGFNVLTAGDGATAVRKVEEKADAIDVILLDVTMPGMDGVVAYDEILRVRPDAHIVMTSGHPISEVERFFGGRRGFPFIQKPYTLHSLAAILKLVLEADM